MPIYTVIPITICIIKVNINPRLKNLTKNIQEPVNIARTMQGNISLSC